MSKKIVITGASGFLGSHLVQMLRNDKQYEVYALSSKPEQLKEKLGGPNVEYRNRCMLDYDMMKDSIVINCAYPRNSTGNAIADGLEYIQKIFEFAVEKQSLAIINISSQSVYSQHRMEVATEDTPVCLETPYAVGKFAVELMLESICKGSETHYTSLRMASLIGPGFEQRIVNRLARQLLSREPITIVKQKKKMGFLDVEDAVSAILAVICTAPQAWQPVYNVGNGRGYTIEEIYNSVVSELSDRVELAPVIYETGSDASSTALSYERLNRDTGFVPVLDLRESVEKIIAKM